MTRHPVIFVGAGPGAPDLITLRGMRTLQSADLIVWAGSLVPREVLTHARADTETIDSAGMTLTEQVAHMAEGHRAGKRVVRLHTGDPSLYGAVAEQWERLSAEGVPFEVVPGVSSLFAAAAAIPAELTVPGISQSVAVCRAPGRTPVPDGQDIASFAAHGTTLAIFLSASHGDHVAAELAEHYPPDTPVAIAERVSWPDERVVHTTVAGLAGALADSGISRTALILVGRALAGAGERRSHLYHESFSHGYRGASPGEQVPLMPKSASYGTTEPNHQEHCLHTHFNRPGRIAVLAVSESGAELALRLAKTLPDAELWVSRKAADGIARNTDSKHTGACCADESRTPNVRISSAQNTPSACNTWSGSLRDHVGSLWPRCSAIVMVAASGIVVRSIAPYVASKHTDPAVVAVDDAGRFAIALLSGHEGGANALADDIAGICGALPVVTTGTEAARGVVVGIGSRRGVSAEAVLAAIDEALAASARSRTDVRALATIDLKRDEPGVREAARRLGVVLRVVDRRRIHDLQEALRQPSFAEEVTGVAAVCVPAALLAGSSTRLLAPPVARDGVKVAIAEDDCLSSASGPEAPII